MDAVNIDTPILQDCVNDGLGVENIIMTGSPITGVHAITEGAGVIAFDGSPF